MGLCFTFNGHGQCDDRKCKYNIVALIVRRPHTDIGYAKRREIRWCNWRLPDRFLKKVQKKILFYIDSAGGTHQSGTSDATALETCKHLFSPPR